MGGLGFDRAEVAESWTCLSRTFGNTPLLTIDGEIAHSA